MNIGSTRKLHACFGFPRKGQSRGTVTVKSAQDPYNVGGEDASSLVGSEITSIDPEVFRQHVQLVWNVNKGGRPEECACCIGKGVQDCHFCGGSGYLTVGDVVICDLNGCKKCPVCKGNGICKCPGCKGTGWRARWMSPHDCQVTR